MLCASGAAGARVEAAAGEGRGKGVVVMVVAGEAVGGSGLRVCLREGGAGVRKPSA